MKQSLRILLILMALLYLIPAQAQKVSLVYDINPKETTSSINPSNFVTLNNKLYFSAYDINNGNSLWVYDGTNNPKSTAPFGVLSIFSNLTVCNNKIYFEYQGHPPSNLELWEYDGTTYKFIKELAPNYNIQPYEKHYSINLGVYNNKLFFSLEYSPNKDVYCYDGNTVKLSSLKGNTKSQYLEFKNKLYFTNPCLCVYNDTLPPSPVYKDNLNHAFCANNLIIYKEKLYFTAFNTPNKMELWEFDGTNYPKLIADNWLQYNDTPSSFAVYNDKLYFRAMDAAHGSELWVYDGVNAPTLVADILPGSNNSYPDYLTVCNNKLYFSAWDDVVGNELWVYDGINAPTAVTDIIPGAGLSKTSQLYVFNNQLFFNAFNGEYTYEYVSENDGGNVIQTPVSDLWCYDETKTPHLTCYKQKIGDDSKPRYMTTFKDKLYFFADPITSSTTDLLWSYDAISKPTKMFSFSDRAFDSQSNINNFIEWNNKLYFTAQEKFSGRELWYFDGVNTYGQMELYPGSGSGFFEAPNFIIFNGKLYFLVRNQNIYSLSQSGGYTNVTNPARGNVGFSISSLTVFQNKLCFFANDNSSSSDMYLWTCDGGGINPPTQILNSKFYSHSKSIVFKNKLYFKE